MIAIDNPFEVVGWVEVTRATVTERRPAACNGNTPQAAKIRSECLGVGVSGVIGKTRGTHPQWRSSL